jgi:hypothetical protein
MKSPYEVQQLRDIAHHRNGGGGASFWVLRFQDGEGRDMLGVVFDEPRHVAVFEHGRLARGDIEFGSNSWRGDGYEPHLRAAIRQYEAAMTQSTEIKRNGEQPDG